MTIMKKILVGGAGLAALATAAPSAAQYGYSYGAPYGYAYGYNANVTAVAAQQCSAAVQNRLNRRVGLGGIVGAMLGVNTNSGRNSKATRAGQFIGDLSWTLTASACRRDRRPARCGPSPHRRCRSIRLAPERAPAV